MWIGFTRRRRRSVKPKKIPMHVHESWYKRFLFYLINLYVITWIKILVFDQSNPRKVWKQLPLVIVHVSLRVYFQNVTLILKEPRLFCICCFFIQCPKSNEKCLELYPEISSHHTRNKWVTSWLSLLVCHLVKRDYEDPIRLKFR